MARTVDQSLFVWRGESKAEPEFSGGLITAPMSCPWCRRKPDVEDSERGTYGGNEYLRYSQWCPLCGWSCSISWTGENYGDADRVTTLSAGASVSVLKKFDISSPELRIEELGTHLKENFHDVYDLDPARFEDLCAGLLKEHGAQVLGRRHVKDHGADIDLLAGGERTGIVQVKRFGQHRRIHVSLVRELMGTAVDFGVREMYLMTSTDRITIPASKLAERYRVRGYRVEFIRGSEILSMLGVYNTLLPPLHELDENSIDGIVANNRAARRTRHGAP